MLTYVGYIFILVGILWSFELHVMGGGDLQQNFIILSAVYIAIFIFYCIYFCVH